MPAFPFEEWIAAQVRVTAFPSKAQATPPAGWWEAAVGQGPAIRAEDRRTAASEETGPFDGREDVGLVLRLEPFRFDWLVLPRVDDPSTTPSPPDVGRFAERLPALLNVVRSWLEKVEVPPLSRLAFGAVLHHPVEDLEAGYRELSSFIGRTVNLDPARMREAAFQVNWPGVSRAVSGMPINRLTKWSVASLIRSTTSRTAEPQTTFFTRLELDVNTDKNRDMAATPSTARDVLGELTAAACEIAANGEIQ